MRRSAIQKLKEPVWGTVDGTDLEILVNPSQAGILTEMMMSVDRRTDRKVCQKVFTDFKNYKEDDDSNIPNSLDARMELLMALAVRSKIVQMLSDFNDESLLGETGDGTV